MHHDSRLLGGGDWPSHLSVAEKRTLWAYIKRALRDEEWIELSWHEQDFPESAISGD